MVSFKEQHDEGNQRGERSLAVTHGTEKPAKMPGFGNIEVTGEFKDWGEGSIKGDVPTLVYPWSWHFPGGKMKLGPTAFGPCEQ